MNIYEKNIMVIKELREPFYRRLSKVLDDSYDFDNFELLETRDSIPTILVHTESESIRMNSLYHPNQEAERWAQKYVFHNINSVVEMYGLGNGIFVRQLLKQMNKEDTIIIYEPSLELFLFTLNHYDISDLFMDSRLLISINGCNEVTFDDYLLRKVSWYNIQSQYMIVHPQYDKLYPEKFMEFIETLRSNADRAVINRNTDAYLGRMCILTMFQNIQYLIGSNIIQDIKQRIPKDLPAIIVSAGPSLKKNIDVLKKCKGRAFIIAVDTCLPFLEKYGVEPDFFITIDPRKSLDPFACKYAQSVPMITKIEGKPRALANNHGHKVFYSSHEFMSRLYQRVGIHIDDYTSGGSVATGAFSVCAAIGFKTIVLVGQDLAYSGNETHIGGRVEEQNGNLGIREVEGIDGTMVKTRYDWLIYLNWFEGAIESVPNIECIDATEGGAKIHGTEIMTLQEVLENKCTKEFDVAKMLDSIPPTLDEKKIDVIYNALIEDAKDITDIKTKSGEIVSIITKSQNEMKRGNYTNTGVYAQKIQDISTTISKCEIYTVIDTYMAEFARKELKDIYTITDDEHKNTQQTFQQAKDFYLHVIRSCDEIKLLLSDGTEQFRKRKEELDEHISNHTC